MDFEYRVVPAPKRLKKIKGVSSTGELFARTLTEAINAEARNGWEYVRAEALTAEAPRRWFRRAAVVEETLLIFRRDRGAGPRLAAVPDAEPELAILAPAAERREHEAEPKRERPEPRVEPRTAAPQPGPRSPRAVRPGNDLAKEHPPAHIERRAGADAEAPRVRSGAPDKRPKEPPRRPAGEPAPSLLRPVPRFRPDEKT